MAWLLKWIHYRPGHTGASCLPEATGSKQITYDLAFLPVPKVGGRSWWLLGVGGWGRTSRERGGPCPSLEEGSPRVAYSDLDLEGLSSSIYQVVRQGKWLII